MSDYPAPRPEGHPSQAQLSTSTETGSGATSAADTAQEQAGLVAGEAKDQTRQVAEHAAAETKRVVVEAKSQFTDLLWQSRSELSQQASAQQQRLAHGLRSLCEELDEMTVGSQRQGLAGEAAAMLSGRIHEAADFLENRDFSGALDELAGFARRRPGTFLLGAALLGVVAGRVTRGLTSDSTAYEPTPQEPLATAYPSVPDVPADPSGAFPSTGDEGEVRRP